MGSADLIETQNWAGENLRLNFFAKIFQEKFGGQWTAEAVATSRVSDFFGTQDLVLFAPQIHIFTKSRLDIFLYSCYSQHIKNNVKFPQNKSSRTGHLFEYIP